MPIVFLHGVSFSGLTWTFKLLPSKHTGQYMVWWPICQYTVEPSVWSLRV